MRTLILTLFLWGTLLPALRAGDKVVLLHGLVRTPASMKRLEKALTKEGYEVVNLGYRSREFNVEALSEQVRAAVEKECVGADRIHFVTHSLGGILVRQIQKQHPIDNIGRVVMLSPPNQGSDIVDVLDRWPLFEWINGPAGMQLGTEKTGLISGLGAVEFECGIVTGDRSINWILSMMIPGKDDGKVSVHSARVEGMKAFKVVHGTHPFIMKKRQVIRDVIRFLDAGRF